MLASDLKQGLDRFPSWTQKGDRGGLIPDGEFIAQILREHDRVERAVRREERTAELGSGITSVVPAKGKPTSTNGEQTLLAMFQLLALPLPTSVPSCRSTASSLLRDARSHAADKTTVVFMMPLDSVRGGRQYRRYLDRNETHRSRPHRVHEANLLMNQVEYTVGNLLKVDESFLTPPLFNSSLYDSDSNSSFRLLNAKLR